MKWIEIIIEEYKTVRTESLESIKSQQTTLNIGTAIAGAIVVAGFNLWQEDLLPALIFLFFIPLICYLILLIWLGEVSRMMRAGKYLKEIEEKISKQFKKKANPLNFENWLREKKKDGTTEQTKWNYISVIALFLFFALSSIAIGNWKIFNQIDCKLLIVINIIEVIFLLIICLFIYFTQKRYQ